MRIFFSLLIFCSFSFTQNLSGTNGFNEFLIKLKKESIKKNLITKEKANAFFNDIKYLKKVIKSNKNQTHKKYTFETYMSKVVSKSKIKTAKENKKLYFNILDKIENKYKVNKETIVALWGIETHFGKYVGKEDISNALATLAYSDKKKKRRAFFKKEFLIGLEIIKQQNLKKKDFKGSWAGAMGQCQFMPSSYKAYAQDFNKDGFADIWNTKEDIFASIANYLKSHKYKYNEPIYININKSNYHLIKKIKNKRKVSEFRKIGIKIPQNINAKLKAKIIHIKNSNNKNGAYILAFDNYYVIRRWNSPIFFITSVSKLASSIL